MEAIFIYLFCAVPILFICIGNDYQPRYLGLDKDPTLLDYFKEAFSFLTGLIFCALAIPAYFVVGFFGYCFLGMIGVGVGWFIWTMLTYIVSLF